MNDFMTVLYYLIMAQFLPKHEQIGTATTPNQTRNKAEPMQMQIHSSNRSNT